MGSRSPLVYGGDEDMEPVTPTGQYYNSSFLCMCNLVAFELELPFDFPQTLPLLQSIFLINPRFSSLLVTGNNGEKYWKKVTVNVEDHIKVPVLDEYLACYDESFEGYFSKIASERLSLDKPLWEIHVFNYPTSNATATALLKFHHALGDGYSLMGAMFSCLQRADNPSLPLNFPSIHSDDYMRKKKSVLELLTLFKNTVTECTWSLLKSNVLEDHASPIRSAEEGVELRPVSISTITFALDEVKQIKAKLGGTVNDMIVGITFYATRLYMEATVEGSGNARSTALVVVNTREINKYQSVDEMLKPETKGQWGNNFGFFHVSIPEVSNTDTTDPLEFVFKAKKTITNNKNSLVVHFTGILIEWMRRLRGSEETSKYIQKVLRKSSLVISNLIGPVQKVSFANNPIKGFYFTSVNVPQSFTIITVVSYMGKLRITVAGDKDLIKQKLFKTCMENAFQKIFQAAMSTTSSSSK